jgi:LPXTG-motif cell wall-anchored protein
MPMSRLHSAPRPGVAASAGGPSLTGRRQVKRRWTLRLSVAIAALGLMVPGMIGSSGAQAAPDVVYDAIGPTLPSNVTSQSFGALRVSEFGDLVSLAPGSRELTTVSVVLSSWACETGSGPTCVTADGATFDHPLTMTLYNVAGTSAAPTVGAVITTITSTFAIPFRPSADLANCTASAGWFDGTSCSNGLALEVDFVFPAGTVLPDTLIWGIAYNTSFGGYSPLGAAGPYDSLNVGAFSVNPTVGTDVDEDMVFISYQPTGGFASELEWTGFRPMARIEATTTVAPTTTTTTTTTAAPAVPTTSLSPGGQLPATGGDSGTALRLALVCLIVGAALVIGARRRSDAG